MEEEEFGLSIFRAVTAFLSLLLTDFGSLVLNLILRWKESRNTSNNTAETVENQIRIENTN